MFGSTSGSPLSTIIPIVIVVAVVLLRNSRARRLRIETLWVFPVIYIGLLASSLAAAPPPITPLSVGILVAAFLIGAAMGWQRGRFTEIRIHPETHDLSAQQSPIGMV